ncbi:MULTISPECIES: hypothetical protein [Pseudomonadati]|uniref:hypothetical protein n=1 Tax=unclassified Halobacteriovorax TaxID=2639665 RepID=UPI000CD29D95|nr:hypothetical protein [Halobacteriovorax sp. DA5]POB13693.1 hypothetical protein C0Z22_09060 [Halobacteriovorax sp. DA5]
MKDSNKEMNMKTNLRTKAAINPPKEMNAAFKTKFTSHLKAKQKKRAQWLCAALASITICLAVVVTLSLEQPSSSASNVKDYLAYIESNFTNDDQVLESIDELSAISYNYIDVDGEYSDY